MIPGAQVQLSSNDPWERDGRRDDAAIALVFPEKPMLTPNFRRASPFRDATRYGLACPASKGMELKTENLSAQFRILGSSVREHARKVSWRYIPSLLTASAFALRIA